MSVFWGYALSVLVLPAFMGTVGLELWAAGVVGAGGEAEAETQGVWTSAEELAGKPMAGPAWNRLKAHADRDPGQADLSNINHAHNTDTLAIALVYARTGEASYRERAIREIMEIRGTEDGGKLLGPARNIAAYVMAADLVGLPPDEDAIFRDWLRAIRHKDISGKNLYATHQTRTWNWATASGATLAAIAVYLGEDEEVARIATIFRGWLGDRASHPFSDPSDLELARSWLCTDWIVGINPTGCEKDGHNLDGVLPMDQQRCGDFSWPPCKTDYAYTGLAGANIQAEILFRAGYDTWQWEDRALLRAYAWLQETIFADGTNHPPEGGSKEWHPWLINARYGTHYPAQELPGADKSIAWLEWTHGPGRQDVQPGDLTGDGQVTLADLRLLVSMLLGQAPLEQVLTGQAAPSAKAKALAAPADRLTLADALALLRILGGT